MDWMAWLHGLELKSEPHQGFFSTFVDSFDYWREVYGERS
jgi:hypothetical protein